MAVRSNLLSCDLAKLFDLLYAIFSCLIEQTTISRIGDVTFENGRIYLQVSRLENFPLNQFINDSLFKFLEFIIAKALTNMSQGAGIKRNLLAEFLKTNEILQIGILAKLQEQLLVTDLELVF